MRAVVCPRTQHHPTAIELDDKEFMAKMLLEFNGF